MNSCLLLKFFAASILMLSAKAESSTEVSSADFEELMNLTVNECKIKENASDEDVLSATTIIGDWPQTREGKCFIDCFLEEIGIFQDHKFSKRGFFYLASMVFDGIEEDSSHNIKKFNDIFVAIQDKCDNSDTSDRCDHALEFAECFDNVVESFDFGNTITMSGEVEK